MVRKHGLAIDRLCAVELVTADGQFLRASAEEHAASCSGVCAVAAATSVLLLPSRWICIRSGWCWEAPGCLRCGTRPKASYWPMPAMQPLAPDELTTMAMLMAAPPAPFIPPEKQGTPSVAIIVCYTGDLVEGARVVAPLRTRVRPLLMRSHPCPTPATFAMTEQATVRGLQHAMRSLFLRTVSDEVVHTIVEEAAAIMSPMTIVQVRILGGAMSKVALPTRRPLLIATNRLW